MIHKEDETLDLLGKYTKRKEPIKTKPLENIKERIIYRDVGKFTTKADKKNNNNQIFKILGIIVIILIFITIYKNITITTNNPIIGTWRTNTIFGTMEIEFDKNTVSAFGGVTNVKYEIKENKIFVFDKDLKIGTYYIIYDQNTMYTEAMGIKTIYKRIK